MLNRKERSLKMNGESKKSFFQFIRFAVIGVLNTGIDYGLYTVLVYLLPIHWLAANIISYASAVLFSYFANKYWTFKKKSGANFAELLRMYGVNIVSLAASSALIYVLVNIIKIPDIAVIGGFLIKKEITAKICVAPVVIIINFIGTKLLVFKQD